MWWLILEDRKQWMEIGNKAYGLEMRDRGYGTRDKDGDGQNWLWDGNVRCGFNNFFKIL